MKTTILFFTAAMIYIFANTTTVNAQDWKKQNPEMNKVLVDTTILRAAEVSIEPGKKSDVHTHPAHFFYALTDCKLTIRTGKKRIMI